MPDAMSQGSPIAMGGALPITILATRLVAACGPNFTETLTSPGP